MYPKRVDQILNKCAKVKKYNNRPEWVFLGAFDSENVFKHKYSGVYKLGSRESTYTYIYTGMLGKLSGGAPILSDEFRLAKQFLDQ